jgi:hypothetical protein
LGRPRVVNFNRRTLVSLNRREVVNFTGVCNIIGRMDWQVEVGLSKLADLVALSPEWPAIKANIKAWMDLKRDDVIEQ